MIFLNYANIFWKRGGMGKCDSFDDPSVHLLQILGLWQMRFFQLFTAMPFGKSGFWANVIP